MDESAAAPEGIHDESKGQDAIDDELAEVDVMGEDDHSTHTRTPPENGRGYQRRPSTDTGGEREASPSGWKRQKH